MRPHELTRRRFFVAIIALWGVGAALRPDLLAVSRAFATSPPAPDDVVRKAMLRMAQLFFPHDALADEVYGTIIDLALTDTANESELAGHFIAAEAALDGDSWLALDEAGQLDALRSIETEPFFAAIREYVRAAIYNGATFWKHVGYLGPSKGFGGYLHRGAGDIDWLPEDA
jgi:hypothetical protein